MKFTAGPAQPLNVGVIAIVPAMFVEPALVEVKLETLPVPLATSPIATFELVQAKVAPAGVLVKTVAGTIVPGHTKLFAGAVREGIGFTVIV